MKRLIARFFKTEGGREPVRDFLLGLPGEDRKIVGQDIATVEFGWPVGMPVCRPLGGGLHEIRSTIRDGKVEVRVYVCVEAQVLVLLHGQQGKGRQDADIALARGRQAELRRRSS
ncbi:type II toxin-antitoxin system RelE/ParE family toxin [Oryzibacter oryziterrae]|uniref:type II toxin-antitoxin system RelE/ParE family toxin n=1 Tax=Oryzibacter oryziterrae TaxID=2766474 RepID=UPI001F159CB4|nr:type II toxin-antitoxin system RelE/ParE family toxin [Oryzibacter oryziterrae]